MTQDEIIEMARQAGCPMADMMPMYFTDKQLLSMLEAFAKLVAEKKREKILAVLRRKPDQQIYKVLDEIRSMK
jgi:hypothetical protein